MTLLVASTWGGCVSLVTDRRISRGAPPTTTTVDEEAGKLLAVYCANALFAIAYTGIAVAENVWMDEAIASCLAFRNIKPAMIQRGSYFLSRPLHEVLKNLCFNLPIRLRSNPAIAREGLTLAITGWHLQPRMQPFVCELIFTRDSIQVGGSMKIKWHPVGRHFRHYPGGFWLQTWGDEDDEFEVKLQALEDTQGLTHDDVERYIVAAVIERGQRTPTVGDQCLALQIDPSRRDAHIQFTYYPSAHAEDPHSLLSGWVLAPTSIHSPTRESTNGGEFSDCGRYVHGGYSDPKAGLFVRNRLPLSSMSYGGPILLQLQAQHRESPPK